VLDVVTFSGSGEPTLHAGIGIIIDHLKKNYPYPVAVLTNGVLLKDPEVRKRIAGADIVVPSLDAVTLDVFNKILRPAEGVTPDGLVESMALFRKEFSGKLLIEIFIVPGINDTSSELALLKQACELIQPDEVQVNSLDRPGAEGWVTQATTEKLQEIKDYFQPLNVRIIGRALPRGEDNGKYTDADASILATIERRPSTIEDLESTTGLRRTELLKRLGILIENKKILEEQGPRGTYYRPAK
jgi:wyosine [tRNA(Phe)-imidazoG37] synthetase (radical SAM superfamily)